ncbi:hypothetical protein [Flavobacterium sp.]|jgi:hypothetical protein|uniref:hypothetical protein n=1 Tax=Flavobacterium sp. TaxID=239 RepID=UPI0037C139AD
MKKYFLVFVSIIALFSSCDNQVSGQDNNKVTNDVDRLRAIYDPMVYGTGQFAKGGPASNFVWSTQSDYISSSNGCHTVQVRVYLTWQGQTSLVASDTVMIGENCPKRRLGGESDGCSGLLPDGNFVEKDNADEIYCLYELLTVNSDIYESYRSTIEKL